MAVNVHEQEHIGNNSSERRNGIAITVNKEVVKTGIMKMSLQIEHYIRICNNNGRYRRG